MTDQPHGADPEASLRAELLSKLGRAESSLGAAIEQLCRTGGGLLLTQSETQLASLIQLQASIGSASAADLAMMPAQVIAAVAVASASAEQARTAATAEAAQALAKIDAETRRDVQSMMHDIYDRKIFEPYLRFSSAEDKTAYREREEANRRAIEAALAKKTPEGDLDAAALTHRQLLDAGAHGADTSPEYASMLSKSQTGMDELGAAVKKSGGSTARADAIARVEPSGALAPDAPALSANALSIAPKSEHDATISSVLATLKAAGVSTKVEPAVKAEHGLVVSDQRAAANTQVG